MSTPTTPVNNNNTTKISSEIIYESALLKKGKYQNTFKPKWFVLLSNQLLVYYSSKSLAHQNTNNNNNICDGSIDLKTVNNLTIITQKQKQNQKQKPYPHLANSLSISPKLNLPSSSFLQIRSVRSLSMFEQLHVNDPQINYLIELSTSSRTYILSSSSSIIIEQWIYYLENVIFGGIIHSGYLLKQGGKWKSWKKRWFTLDSTQYILKYYENDTLKSFRGEINLLNVINLCYGDKQTNGKDFTIELNTDTRCWIIAANSIKNRNVWCDKIKNVINNLNNTAVKPAVAAAASSVSKPKVKRVKFADNNISINYNLDNTQNDDVIDSVSRSGSDDNKSVIIYPSPSPQPILDNDGHKRTNTRISIVVTNEDGDGISSCTDSSSSFDTKGSLDAYSYANKSGNSLLSNPLDDDNDDGIDDVFKSLQFKGNLLNDNSNLDGIDDAPVTRVRFNSNSQISVTKWNDDSNSDNSDASGSDTMVLTSNNHNKNHHSYTSTLASGYKYKGLKTQFYNVHDIDLKTENYDNDIKTNSVVSFAASSDSDSDDINFLGIRKGSDKDNINKTHIKTKSSMRSVEFDQRFKKIYKKRKKQVDIVKCEENMLTKWNNIMLNDDITQDTILNDAEMKWDEMQTDLCITRLVIILEYYHLWIYNTEHKQGITASFEKLCKYSVVSLLNDFYHIKCNYGDNNQLIYLRLYFLQQTSINCDIYSCIMLLRCNRDKVKMSSEFLLRRNLYFLSFTKLKGDLEILEVVLQQLLDSIYSFIFYGEYFSINDNNNNLINSIDEYTKTKTNNGKYTRNILYKYRNSESLIASNKFCSNIKYENELYNNDNDNSNNIFGVNMRYGTRIEYYYISKYHPFYQTMKQELMNHSKYEISIFQYKDVIYKCNLFRQTYLFNNQLLLSKTK